MEYVAILDKKQDVQNAIGQAGNTHPEHGGGKQGNQKRVVQEGQQNKKRDQ